MERTVHILVQGKLGLDQTKTLGNQQRPDCVGADARYDDLFGELRFKFKLCPGLFPNFNAKTYQVGRSGGSALVILACMPLEYRLFASVAKVRAAVASILGTSLQWKPDGACIRLRDCSKVPSALAVYPELYSEYKFT